MFMLGCAGDSNPYPRGTMDNARDHGQTLAAEVGRVLEGKLKPVNGPLTIAFGRVDLPLQTGLTRETLEKIAGERRNAQSYGAKKMLESLERNEALQTHYNCPFSVWQFGTDLTLAALSGEVVVDYVTMLEKALGPNQLWVAAYCDDVYGYLPSARVISEGGYETRGLYAGGAGFFDVKAQDVVVEHVRALAKQAGRGLPE
jgi:neutral ceramidase